MAGVLAAELIFGVRVAFGPGAQPPTTIAIGDRTLRMTNLGGRQSQPVLDRVAADISQAVGAVDAFWGTEWPRDIDVVATGTPQQFEALAGGGTSAQWADIAAIAVADHVDTARRTASGQRIVLAPGAAGMSDRAFQIVLSHELFHYAARADTAVDAPRWLTESVADYVARPRTPKPEVATPPSLLPSDTELADPGAQRSQAYDRAWWFALYVADTRGPPTLRALYQRACGDAHADLDTALHDVLGTDTAKVLADWQRWLTR